MNSSDNQKESDIEKVLRYLKIHEPEKATREPAIEILDDMQLAAHILAHDIVTDEQKKKSTIEKTPIKKVFEG
jgi:hypothetical protein